MNTAGIAWTDHGFESVVMDAGQQVIEGSAFYRSTEMARLCYELANRALNTELACIIDSTNGMLDERLAAANLTVYRADPDVLPAELRGGSVPAAVLARVGCEHLPNLTKLGGGQGTLEGRMDEARQHNGISIFEKQLRARRLCIDSGDESSKQVFLTFDDGPSPYTANILDTLRRHEAKATFFCIGLHALGYADLIKEMIRHGHAVGNHTWSHAFSPDLDTHNWSLQLKMTASRLLEITGVPCQLFRPPYGVRTIRDLELVTQMAMKTVLWTVDSKDWARPGAGAIIDRVVSDTRNGSIVLLHDGGGDRSQTVEALPWILSQLKRSGYVFHDLGSFFGDGEID